MWIKCLKVLLIECANIDKYCKEKVLVDDIQIKEDILCWVLCLHHILQHFYRVFYLYILKQWRQDSLTISYQSVTNKRDLIDSNFQCPDIFLLCVTKRKLLVGLNTLHTLELILWNTCSWYIYNKLSKMCCLIKCSTGSSENKKV